MQIRANAIVCAVRPQGETACVVRVLTADHGIVAGYVPGGRGRNLRPVAIPGNEVEIELRARPGGGLPFMKLELLTSRAPWLTEPLPAAAIGWACALTAVALPERQDYSPLHQALDALLTAICHAPSARGWAGAMIAYETLMLRELGYGGGQRPAMPEDWPGILAIFDRVGKSIDHYLLAGRRSDVMAARAMLRERLARIAR